jgi:hypothetical protein
VICSPEAQPWSLKGIPLLAMGWSLQDSFELFEEATNKAQKEKRHLFGKVSRLSLQCDLGLF